MCHACPTHTSHLSPLYSYFPRPGDVFVQQLSQDWGPGRDSADHQTLTSQDVTGVVPFKGRPGSSWASDAPLTAEPLLQKAGSILGLHLTSRHLLILHASSALSGAATIWLDSNSLEPIHRLALPAGVCYAWAEFGLQKALISTSAGDIYTLPTQPKASCLLTGHLNLLQPQYIYCVTVRT